MAKTGTGTDKSGTGTPKRRGRPPGAKNKKKTGTGADSGEQLALIESGTGTQSSTCTDLGTGADVQSGTGEKKRIGRPKGSKSGYTRSAKTIAQRREATLRSARAREGLNLSDEDREYNRRHIEHVLKIHEIATQADRKDPASLRACFLNYVALCAQDGFKVGNIAAAAAMGVDCYQLENWAKSANPEYKELAQFVKRTCSLFREGMVADGKVNPVIGIFWQRNFDGLRNDTEQIQAVQTAQEDTNEGMTAEDYRKKYGDLIGE